MNRLLLEIGTEELPAGYIQPAGSIAMDILRIEAGFFLFTNECRVRPTIDDPFGGPGGPAGAGDADPFADPLA